METNNNADPGRAKKNSRRKRSTPGKPAPKHKIVIIAEDGRDEYNSSNFINYLLGTIIILFLCFVVSSQFKTVHRDIVSINATIAEIKSEIDNSVNQFDSLEMLTKTATYAAMQGGNIPNKKVVKVVKVVKKKIKQQKARKMMAYFKATDNPY